MGGKQARSLFGKLINLSMLFGLVVGQISPTHIDELCTDTDNELEVVPYPGDPTAFILCVPKKSSEVFAPRSDIDVTDISYEAAKNYCRSAPILTKVSFFNCQNYYICSGEDKDPIQVACPSHEHYSKYKEECTSPWEAYCMPIESWCEEQEDGVRFTAANCFQYYECSNRETQLQTCPYNRYYSEEKQACVPGICKNSDGSISNERKPNCSDYREGEFMVHRKCHKYFVCVKDMVYEGMCSPGHYFEEETSLCLRDVNNTCTENLIKE